ncbi:hypothetical protein ACI8B_130046 [Acinetobacter proteolyticus]|uniref:Uncharacterized protein n=1 Tax=Acinetobacter proteolyticus TaxID=1776741 RepID=A0A653K1W9_9GAMM|nr:hypothetical protein ACI8B_130046 [Acinetobacter proteolyticus]
MPEFVITVLKSVENITISIVSNAPKHVVNVQLNAEKWRLKA